MTASDLDIAHAAPLFLGDDQSTAIRCGVGDFKVRNGLLNSQIFVLDTKDSNLEGHANIDLDKELMDVQLDAHPKEASPLSLKGPITISGPFKHPNVGVDIAKTGARGGVAAALGAVLTPLAAILPFLESGGGKDANCGVLLERARKDAKAGGLKQ